MEYFIDFVHFLNLEKKFVFQNTKSFQNSLSEEQYNELEYDDNKLLKYNEYTIEEFKNYINSNKGVIKNEIQDVFQKQNKELLTELHNRLLFLEKQLSGYKKCDGTNFIYPDPEIKDFSQLTDMEKSEIREFLKLESDFVFKIRNQIKALEKEFHYNRLIKNKSATSGFTFNSNRPINYKPIFLLIKDKLMDCDEDTFRKVFSEEELKSSPQIKWILKNRNGSINKRALFYFLDQPIFKELDEKEIVEKVDYCFVEFDGKRFSGRTRENFRQYRDAIENIESSDFKENWKSLIDERIELIRKILKD